MDCCFVNSWIDSSSSTMSAKDDEEEYKETDDASSPEQALEEETGNVAATEAATTVAATGDSSFPQLLPHFESLLQQIADTNWKKNYLALVQKNRTQESSKGKHAEGESHGLSL